MSGETIGYRLRWGTFLVHVARITRDESGPVWVRTLCGGMGPLLFPMGYGVQQRRSLDSVVESLEAKTEDAAGWQECPRCRERVERIRAAA